MNIYKFVLIMVWMTCTLIPHTFYASSYAKASADRSGQGQQAPVSQTSQAQPAQNSALINLQRIMPELQALMRIKAEDLTPEQMAKKAQLLKLAASFKILSERQSGQQ